VDITQHHQDKHHTKPEILPGLKNIEMATTHNEPNHATGSLKTISSIKWSLASVIKIKISPNLEYYQG
jgi:hypothetical protein